MVKSKVVLFHYQPFPLFVDQLLAPMLWGFFLVSVKQEGCWFHGSSFQGFSVVFLLPDWLKLNHLKSQMECGFSDIFRTIFAPP